MTEQKDIFSDSMDEEISSPSKKKKKKRKSKSERFLEIDAELDAALKELDLEEDMNVDEEDVMFSTSNPENKSKSQHGKLVKKETAKHKAKLRKKSHKGSSSFIDKLEKASSIEECDSSDKTNDKKKLKKSVKSKKSRKKKSKIHPDDFVEQFDNLLDEVESISRKKKKKRSERRKVKKRKSEKTMELRQIQLSNEEKSLNKGFETLFCNQASCLLLIVLFLEADMPGMFFEQLLKSVKMKGLLETLAPNETIRKRILECS